VPRTFPEHPLFNTAEGQQQLLRVLKAYAAADPEVRTRLCFHLRVFEPTALSVQIPLSQHWLPMCQGAGSGFVAHTAATADISGTVRHQREGSDLLPPLPRCRPMSLQIGYCQGMAFAAGVLLMYMPEEPAFRWVGTGHSAKDTDMD
jgi:hypothetical protein